MRGTLGLNARYFRKRRKPFEGDVVIIKATGVIVVAFALGTTGCWALGGFTFGQNPYTHGPYYDTPPPPDSRGRCVWRQKWTVEKSGRKIRKRVRVCH
jgi:hypothetical protein